MPILFAARTTPRCCGHFAKITAVERRGYWLDVSLDETLHRHTTRPQATQFSADATRSWYRAHDPLDFVTETIVAEESTVEETVERILADLQREPRKPNGAHIDAAYIVDV